MPGGSWSKLPGITPAHRNRQDALRAPGRAARPRPADRPARPDAALPRAQANAGAQEAGQRDHRRVRPRTRLLPLGRSHRAVTRIDIASPLGWGGAGPRSPLVRAKLLWAALTRPRPLLDTRQPATEPATWGSQPPHMRLTDVEQTSPGASPPEHPASPTPPNDSIEGGPFNAAHLTDAPPYEKQESGSDPATKVT
jgi:hypothetical protein